MLISTNETKFEGPTYVRLHAHHQRTYTQINVQASAMSFARHTKLSMRRYATLEVLCIIELAMPFITNVYNPQRRREAAPHATHTHTRMCAMCVGPAYTDHTGPLLDTTYCLISNISKCIRTTECVCPTNIYICPTTMCALRYIYVQLGELFS